MRQTEVSGSSQLYSEHQTVYTLRIKSHMSKVSSHKDKPLMVDKPHMAKACFSIEAYKQITTASFNEYSKANSLLSAASKMGTKVPKSIFLQIKSWSSLSQQYPSPGANLCLVGVSISVKRHHNHSNVYK